MFRESTTAQEAPNDIVCVYHDHVTRTLLEGLALKLGPEGRKHAVLMDVWDLMDHPEEAQAIFANAKMLALDLPSQKDEEAKFLCDTVTAAGRKHNTLFCTGNRVAVTDFFERHAQDGTPMKTSYTIKSEDGSRIVDYHDASQPPHNGLFEKPNLDKMADAMKACLKDQLSQGQAGAPPTQVAGNLSDGGTISSRSTIQLD